MDPAAALIFRDVSKDYTQDSGASLHALRDVTFEIPPRRRVAITGRSGSGKSTLLHLSAGIDVPTRGEVRVWGRDLEKMGERERTLHRRETVGLVFQFFYLLPHLSVRDNVLLPAWIAGDRSGRTEERARMLLDRVEMGDRSGDPVQRLSGGEMQRIAICRALLRSPKILLADEPTGNLDDDTGRRVMDLLLALTAEEGSTLIYVTHSQELASLADETWRLHSGILDRPAGPP